jgi:hypothetical protein
MDPILQQLEDLRLHHEALAQEWDAAKETAKDLKAQMDEATAKILRVIEDANSPQEGLPFPHSTDPTDHDEPLLTSNGKRRGRRKPKGPADKSGIVDAAARAAGLDPSIVDWEV